MLSLCFCVGCRESWSRGTERCHCDGGGGRWTGQSRGTTEPRERDCIQGCIGTYREILQ